MSIVMSSTVKLLALFSDRLADLCSDPFWIGAAAAVAVAPAGTPLPAEEGSASSTTGWSELLSSASFVCRADKLPLDL